MPGRPGTASACDGARLDRGIVLDFRPTEQLLQSHTDLWFTSQTHLWGRRSVWLSDPDGNIVNPYQEA